MLFYNYFECCGLSPEVGCAVLALLSLLTSIGAVVLTIWKLLEEYVPGIASDTCDWLCSQCLRGAWSIGFLAVGVIGLVTTLLLIFGIRSKDRRLMVPWLISFFTLWLVTLSTGTMNWIFLYAVRSQVLQKSCLSELGLASPLILAGILLFVWAALLDLYHRLKPGLTLEEIEGSDKPVRNRSQLYLAE